MEPDPKPLAPPPEVARTRVESAATFGSGAYGSDGGGARAPLPKKGAGTHPNNVRRLRIDRVMSKAELARRANVSVLTIDRVEKGYGCRMDTKRKILEALGLSLADRVRVFGEEE
jgi:DNA-binding XRE family transcriptional regulator